MQSNKPNRIMEILTTEYKGESLLLVLVSIVIMVVSAYIINGTLVINPDFPIIGNFPLLSTIVFMFSGAVGLVIGSWPLFKPSVIEIKRLTPPSRSVYLDHMVKVFTFILLFLVVFILFDSVITASFGLFL
jgi:preprotein translocase subunit SecE